MPGIGATQIGVALGTLLLLCLLWAMILAWGWLLWCLFAGEPVLPTRPLVDRGESPWRAGTVLLILLAYMLVICGVQIGYSLVTKPLPAEPAPGLAKADDPQTNPAANAPPPSSSPKVAAGTSASKPQAPDEKEEMPLSLQLTLNGLINVLMLGLIPGLARLTCGARVRHFGLSFERWWWQAAVGVIATLIATPPVIAIQFLAAKTWPPQAHPVQEIMSKNLTFGTAGLAVLTAVILAPLFEELLFRAFLQTWVVDALIRSALRPLGDSVPIENPPSGPADPGHAQADKFALEAAEPDQTSNPFGAPHAVETPTGDRERRGWLGVVFISVLFGAVHYQQWPAPVALCALALVIGVVYERTGSLIAAVVMHAMFNGLNTLVLSLALLSGAKLEPDKLTEKHVGEHPVNVKIGKRERDESYSRCLASQKVESPVFFLDERASDC